MLRDKEIDGVSDEIDGSEVTNSSLSHPNRKDDLKTITNYSRLPGRGSLGRI